MPPKLLHELNQPLIDVLSTLSYRTGELKTYLQDLAQGVSQLLELDWSAVTLCQDDFEQVLASTVDLGVDADRVYSLHGTLTGAVMRKRSPLIVEDTTINPTCGDIPDGYRAYLGIPLRTPNGKVIGTICSFHHQPRHFTPEEVRLAEIFAERAATAIDNYQLYQQQQRFNEALEAEVIKRTVELRATQAKLMEANAQLELRVEQRTAELQQVNRQLQAEIEERKQTEEKLRQSEEQLRQIAENMNPVLWMYSLEGMPVYMSPAFEEVWGIPLEQWYENPDIWWSVIHPDDRERVCQAFCRKQEHRFEEEYRIVRSDGSIRIIRDQCFPIRDESGRVYRLAGIAEDITERKHTEQEMLRASASLAEVGELAAMIVHEIRNPLTTVWMGLNSFKSMDLSDRSKARLNLALDEAERLQKLLNEILLYARPHTLQRSELELNQFITGLLCSLRIMPSAANRCIQFVPAAAPVHVLADSDKFKQVVINLVSNACEAVADKHVITLSVELIDNQAYIRIHNDGDPIPPDVLPKLRMPFYTTKSSGTGLGLAIVRRIVEAHGGEFAIESSVTTGTLVSVRLEAIQAALAQC